VDEGGFRQGAAGGGVASGIYRKKRNSRADAPQPWQTTEGGQEGQSDAAARPGRVGGIPAGGKRLAGAHQRNPAREHATTPEVTALDLRNTQGPRRMSLGLRAWAEWRGQAGCSN